MTETLTRIRLPYGTVSTGLMDWGTKTATDMIKMIRDHADYLRNEVAAIDATLDDEFRIDVVKGSIVQRHVRNIQNTSDVRAK